MMSLGIGFFADGPWAHKALRKDNPRSILENSIYLCEV